MGKSKLLLKKFQKQKKKFYMKMEVDCKIAP